MTEPGARQRLRRWGAAAIAGAVVVTMGYPLYRTFESRTGPSVVEPTTMAALGENLYMANCTLCHGSGTETGLYTTLNSRQYLASVTDADLTAAIAAGVPGTTMLGYGEEAGGALSVLQVQAVVAYLRSLEATAPEVPD